MNNATETKLTRFDIPASVRNLLMVAQEALRFDILEIYVLAAEFGGNWRGLTDQLCQDAHVQRHHNAEGHKRVVQAAEAVWSEIL
jgi:hypothetical protein